MRKRPHISTHASGWGWILVIGAILLPLSPALAFIGIFLFAFLHDKVSEIYAQWKVEHRKDYRLMLEEEIQKRHKQNIDNERTD